MAKEKKSNYIPSLMKESTVKALDKACEIEGDRSRSYMIEKFCRKCLVELNLLK